jgi:uncharacterized membrane protein
VSEFQEAVADAVDAVIPGVEAIGAAIVVLGVIIAGGLFVASELRIRTVPYEHIRLVLGRFLALAIEFQLAADILRTAVSPTFDDLGQLGAIAAIRTVLNYFLTQEIERAERMEKEGLLMGPDEMPAPKRGSAGA